MRRLALLTGFAVVVGLMAAPPATALNEVRLVPIGSPIGVGDPLDVSLSIVFDDVTLGGAIAISFDDALLELTGISFDAALPDDPDFRCPSAGLPGSVSCPAVAGFVSFGTLAGLPSGTPVLVATLAFVGLAPGTSPLSASVQNPFSDPVGMPLDVSVAGTSVQVVPEPRLTLLLLLGAGAPVALARRRGSCAPRMR